jgi:hypothetical protein
MNAPIREPDEYDVECDLPWTLFDPPESERPGIGETRIGRASAQRPCGFVVVLLRALSAWPT